MATENKILTAEQELKLRQPIDEYVGGIQAKIDALRVDGTDRVIDIQSTLDNLKRDRIYTAQEKEARAAQLKKELEAAKAVENQNKAEISKLIADAESYLKAHYDAEYYQPLLASCRNEKVAAQEKYQAAVAELNKEHQATLSKLTDQHEIKDEKYVHKNRLFDAKMTLAKDLQQVKDRQHAAFDYKYHLIDMLRMSKFTFGETMAQKWENYKYTFNKRDFFLKNGLYLAIIVIFIALCIITPIVKNTQLLTMNNVLNILQQASPRMFLALGVAGLILLAGTDLSIGRMVGMGMTAATIACHNRGSTPSVENSSLLFHSMRRNQVNEASTMQNVVVSVSLVCRLQRFGGRWLRHERMRLSRTGKPSVPQNALTRIGRPTAQLLTCRPAPSGVKPALLYAMTAKNNDSHSVCRTLP
mgnify:CR=1 FL=1